MTDLTSILSSVNSDVNKTASASKTLSADMDTFLTMLTTQLQYQDPLEPMDATEYTNQLVQYSNVEQAIQTNSKLDNLLNMSIYNLGVQATNYVGKTVQVLSDIMPLTDGAAKATYTLNQNAERVNISVKDYDQISQDYYDSVINKLQVHRLSCSWVSARSVLFDGI
jgi:flagellar basal-body rod modification protein FlgD